MTALPNAGDIYWAELAPTLGTEQSGRRPVLVLTDAEYHAKSTRAVVCPITSRPGLWPFEVFLSPGLKTKGVVLVDQLRAVHRTSRLFGFIESAPPTLLLTVRGHAATLIGIDLSI